jgi:hypothetical protein
MTTARETSRPRSWLVVKGKTPEAVCNELHLRAGAYRGDTTKWNLVGAGSDLGWYLVVAHGREHRLINEAVIARLAAGCEVLTCTVEEQQIYSAAAGWRDGHRLWAIAYDGEEGPSDVVIDGDLPHGSSDIRARFTALAQAEDAGDALVDPMFEIPGEIVRSVTGYKFGEPSPGFEGRFVLLEATDRSWLQRLVGS